jgi:hypothetical protein
MNSAWRTASFFLVALTAFGQSKSRDLKYEETVLRGTPRRFRAAAPDRRVAGYKNLPAPAQLEYSERDADSIYSILISPRWKLSRRKCPSLDRR